MHMLIERLLWKSTKYVISTLYILYGKNMIRFDDLWLWCGL